MDEIIRKIIESEHTAKAIVKKAQDERDNLDKELEKNIADMRIRAFERAKKEIDKVSLTENASVKSQTNKLEKNFKEQMEAMRDASEKYQKKWIQTFFASIVGEEYARKALSEKINRES